MPYTTQTSDFWGWYLRHNNRVVWKYLQDAGIDVFTSYGPNANPQAFIDLTNVLPAISGGFLRRWGTINVAVGTGAGSVNPVRTFLYNVPQDQSNPTNTSAENLWITTDNQKWNVLTDGGALSGVHGPSGFAAAGNVGAVTSRSWFYYGNGLVAPRKVNPGYTGANTDSLMGIALSSAAAQSSNYQNYPCVLLPAGPTGTLQTGILNMLSNGGGYYAGQILSVGGGHGTGLLIQVDSVFTGGGHVNAINGFHVLTWGTGYVTTDTVTATAGSPTATFFVQQAPTSALGGTGSGGSGLGYTANSNFTVSVTDQGGGTGTGGHITCYTDSNGAIVSATVSTPGSGYTQGAVAVPAPPTGGVQGYVVVYTQTNAGSPGYGTIVGADVAGPMSFIEGRQWTIALQNSLTGHTSDVWITDVPYGPSSGQVYNTLTSGVISLIDATLGDSPVFVSSQDQTAGFTQINLTLSVPANGLDPQVDTIVLLAAADGQGLGTLYQVAQYPLSSFTLANGFYTKTLYDTLPDSFNNADNVYGVTNTLLEANLWAYTDPAGDTFGILLNTPPTAYGFLYPTLHQGRMFATDGKTVFFSKSLDEVTTSTGLITSKWEECWPGDYQLPVALNNETILGLKSDGTNLHIGTDKSIFTLYGSDPSNFSIPSMAFAETGILSNDTWNVVYAEGQPAGFVWLTQDLRVMHSDFSTYREIGTPIYPYLQVYDTTKLANAKIVSLTHGPYNFAVLQLHMLANGNPQPEFWLWETRLQKWYHWVLNSTDTGGLSTISSCFVYQVPYNTSGFLTPGQKYLFFWQNNGGYVAPRYFNPGQTTDGPGTANIGWSVQTSFQDSGDSTAIKVINEIEFTSNDAPLTVTLYGATADPQFGNIVLKTGPSITGPLSAYSTNKFYCAGTPTGAKYHSVKFAPVSPGTNASVLSSFNWEFYPMTRI